VSEIVIGDTDKLDWAIKKFRRLVQRSGILKDVRKKRHYVKPSLARRIKESAARRRKRDDARRSRSRE
jgi:small subunit ribosomal protein S21